MSKFTFRSEDDYTGETLEMTCTIHDLTDALETYERFLRGAGYHFTGELDFVNDDVSSEDEDAQLSFFLDTKAGGTD